MALTETRKMVLAAVAACDDKKGEETRVLQLDPAEGRRLGEWILMDYVDFVVHIFLRDKRAFYDIERLRKSAKPVDVAELTAALTEKTAAARKKAPVKRAEATKPGKMAVAKKAPAKAETKKPAKKAKKP
jgi:ribosome-associated protein